MTARDWKQFFFAWALVALCALPAVVWGQEVFKVGSVVEMRGMDSCNTLDQARDVANQPTIRALAMRYSHYNAIIEKDGHPACGQMQGFEATIVGVHGTYKVEDIDVTVFSFRPQGSKNVYYGITHLTVLADGTTV